jgi:GNAT superfamily N-acetyltransferase
MLDAYASDPMGGGAPLADDVRERLVSGLREHPTTVILLAFDGAKPIGIATCFRGFSTFAAWPLLNLHDLAVIPEYRGCGVGRKLLAAVEEKARALGCTKVTLEVLEANPARKLYESMGFASPVYYKGSGQALFLTKSV